ncbi:MAG: tubulin/FtsZ family protein [Candidatus Bathyarchaeota archaeon]|nr:tubulin/FtsZ family protein [Candidatus Bathyarchaeota archaeon]MDH5688555.1 tubulin/FtsZ family protein [Candidatus Bathyarchaeota archaeon]
MRLCVIGVGQAGGRVADLFAQYNAKEWSKHGNLVPVSIAINTAKSDLMGLKAIPKANRVLIGQTNVKGHGTGTDNELGARLMKEEMHNINRALSVLGTHYIDAFLVIAGLGGGTGSGGAPILVRYLKEAHEDPVYALGILPAKDEGKLMTFNAARSLLALQESADSVIIFDNESWKREGTSVAESYNHMNSLIVSPFGYLLGGGESDSGSSVGVKVVDAGDIINSLGGLASIGYAEREVDGGFSLFNGKSDSMDRLDTSTLCHSVIKSATAPGSLTAQCDIKDAERALVLVSGPPKYLDREGIERARKFLEDAVWGTEVRGGDYPMPRSKSIVGIVVLSGLINVPRVKEILEDAAATQKTVDKREKKRKEMDDLSEYKGKLKPLNLKSGEAA